MRASMQAGFRSCTGIGRWLPLAVALALPAAVGCQPAKPAESASQAVVAPTVVHVGAQVQDRIDGLDLATGPDGSVHLVWREWPDMYGTTNRSPLLMYQRGHGEPLRWEAPVELAGTTGTPRVVVTRDGVHVFARSRLDHWWLPTGADRWLRQPALLGDHSPRVTDFDVADVGDGLVVAFISGGSAGDQALYTLRWSNGQAGPPIALVRHRAVVRTGPGGIIQLHDPVLAQRDGRLLLLWGTQVPSEIKRDGYTELRLDEQVYAAWSAGAGQDWSEPDLVNDDMATQTTVTALAGVVGPSPLVLFTGHGLFASRWLDGAWSRPQRFAGYDIGALSGSAKAFGVAAGACAGLPLVAWVDGRHQGSDRRWWNPLGGFPWSDSPDWTNNDLFVLAGAGLTAALDGRPATPRRQTTPGGDVEDVAVIDRGDHALLVWAGRASVRKLLTDMDAPPTIWQRRIECD